LSLARYEWGEDGLPALVCLHGVTSHGRHFEQLAERLADRFHVVALDLRGHAGSPWEPPWNLEQHVADVLEAAPVGRVTWLGHSFGARIAYETAAAAPDRVERLVLLDPAILLPPQLGRAAAENARRDRSYVSFEEGIDRRYEESVLTTAPRELVAGELVGGCTETLQAMKDGRLQTLLARAGVTHDDSVRDDPFGFLPSWRQRG